MSGRASSPGRNRIAEIIARAKAKKSGLSSPPVGAVNSPKKQATKIPKPGRARSRPTARAAARPTAGASPGTTEKAIASYRAARSGSKPRRAERLPKSHEASPARGAGRSTSSSRAKRSSSSSRKQARRVVRAPSPSPEPEVFSESDVDSVDTQDHYQEIAGRSAAPERSDSVSDEDTEDEEDASPVVTRRERSSSTTRQSVVKAARRRVRASGPVEVERNLYNDEDEEGDEYRPEDEDEEKAEEAHPGLAVRLPFIVLVALLFMLISAAVIWQRGGAIAMLNAIDVANPVAMGLIGVLSGAIASESSIMKPAVVKICNTVFSKA